MRNNLVVCLRKCVNLNFTLYISKFLLIILNCYLIQIIIDIKLKQRCIKCSALTLYENNLEQLCSQLIIVFY